MATPEIVSRDDPTPPNPETDSEKNPCIRCKSPGSPIGEDACPICLCHITDKAAAGSCLHNFCLVCLKEWAKQKSVCPLCKQSFDRIFYNIKSESDYKEWKVPPKEPVSLSVSFREYLNPATRRFFGYRTTNFPGATRLPRLETHDAIPSGARPQRSSHNYNHRGSSMFRLSIYLNNVWVQPVSDITGIFRMSSPQLYREQPALTHRLVPWVNRELTALLPPARIGVVLTHIMDLIERYCINSREFCRELRPHLATNTVHFLHEFYCFARSPYDMVGHDNASIYIPRYELINEDTLPFSDSSEDDIVEVSSTGQPINAMQQPLDLSHIPQPTSIAREETLDSDGSVVISSDSSSGDELSHTSLSIPPNFFNSHNPEPPESLLLHNARIEFPSIEESLSSTNNLPPSRLTVPDLAEPGPSGVSNHIPFHRIGKIKRENTDESGEECTVVEVLKPKKDRTPEIIDLSSESEHEFRGSHKPKTLWKKRMTKEAEQKNKKGTKRPKLDRSSFSLRVSESRKKTLQSHNNDSNDSSYRNEDTAYANESTSSSCIPSSTHGGSGSEEGFFWRRPCTFSSARRVISDSEESEDAAISTRYIKSKPNNYNRPSTSKVGSSSKFYSTKEWRNSKRKIADQKSKTKYHTSPIRQRNKSLNSHPPSEGATHRNILDKPIKKLVCTEKKFSYYYTPIDRDESSDSSSSSSSSTTSSSSSLSSSSSSSSSDSTTSDDSTYNSHKRSYPQSRKRARRTVQKSLSASEEDIPLIYLSKNKRGHDQYKKRQPNVELTKSNDKKGSSHSTKNRKYR